MEKSKIIYMDYAASVSANPSSLHIFGVNAKIKLQNARKKVASVLNTQSENILFTSSGTESNNLAIQGVVLNWYEKEKKIPHIITTNIEHPSVLETFRMLEKRKLAQISVVAVETNGIVDPKKIKKEIKNNTILISVMYANNEIGTIQPIREIAKEIRFYKKNTVKLQTVSYIKSRNYVTYPIFHTDAVQAVNYLDMNVEKLGIDLLTLSGSKIEGSGKVGLLYKRKTAPLVNIYGGGDQERGFRPGTENLSEIIKFSNALEITNKMKEKEGKRIKILRDYFITKLLQNKNFENDRKGGGETIANPCFAKVVINGDKECRLPNNINITIPKIPSDLLVIELSARGIMVSSKSACKSSSKEGSYVIRAIHPLIDPEIGGLRFSFGRDTKKSDIDYVIKSLSKILNKLTKWYE